MDFPEILETCEFIDESAQMRQSVRLLLQNVVGSFCQDSSLGALFDVHTFDYVIIHAAVHQTLSVLPIEVNKLDVQPPVETDGSSVCRIRLTYTYNNELFTFSNYKK